MGISDEIEVMFAFTCVLLLLSFLELFVKSNFSVVINKTRWSSNLSPSHSDFPFEIISGSLAVEDHLRFILGITWPAIWNHSGWSANFPVAIRYKYRNKGLARRRKNLLPSIRRTGAWLRQAATSKRIFALAVAHGSRAAPRQGDKIFLGITWLS